MREMPKSAVMERMDKSGRCCGRGSWNLFLCALLLGVFAWSAVGPRDRFTWWLEVFPVLIGVPVLAVTYWWFGFAPLVYTLICLHAIVLLVGGHYTYAQVPLFNWIRDYFHLSRNHFDRVGHFMQGLVP